MACIESPPEATLRCPDSGSKSVRIRQFSCKRKAYPPLHRLSLSFCNVTSAMSFCIYFLYYVLVSVRQEKRKSLHATPCFVLDNIFSNIKCQLKIFDDGSFKIVELSHEGIRQNIVENWGKEGEVGRVGDRGTCLDISP